MDGIIRALSVYLVWVVLTSFISFMAYGIDKRRAQRDAGRISERTLHFLDLIGGWPGGWMAQRNFRHKTQKLSFRLVYWLTVIGHLAIVAGLFWSQT